MAIKNPSPNIKDFEINENTTWSSAHIAGGLVAAGVAVGPDGEVNEKPFDLIYNETLTEAKSAITFNDVSYKEVFAVITVSYDTTVTAYQNLTVKTPEKNDVFFSSSAYAFRSFTGGSSYVTILHADCYGSIVKGYGLVSALNGYTAQSSYVANSYVPNIIGSKFTSIEITSTTDAFPVGSIIKVFAR